MPTATPVAAAVDTIATARPEFVFVPHDGAEDRPAGLPSDRERFAIHRAWLLALDAGTMPASKAAVLDRWTPGWRSQRAREIFGVVPRPRAR